MQRSATPCNAVPPSNTCGGCGEPIDMHYFLLCPHGVRPMHPACLMHELEDAIVTGQYRRCECDTDIDKIVDAFGESHVH